MKLAVLLLLAAVVSLLLLNTVLWLGLQVLEMNAWQGALLGLAMWTLVIATLSLSIAGICRGAKAFKSRRQVT